MKSDISGFYNLSIEERIKKIKEFANLNDEDIETLENGLRLETANIMIENVIGMFKLPLGIATNFLINGKDYLIPMVIEEPSVVAAASHAAKLCRNSGGFKTHSNESLMIGQIQLITDNKEKAKSVIIKNINEIKKIANNKDSTLIKLGGGLKSIEFLDVDEKTLDVHIIVDVKDAMGANCVNTMCETIAPFIEKITSGRTLLKIISNLAVKRLVNAEAVWKKEVLGEELIDGILEAYKFAEKNQYRCTTHNKGIMNSVDAVAIAVGNDFRAIEAGAHSYAAFGKKYSPLTKYEKNKNGDLVGRIELPLAVATVGGATKTNPTAKLCMKILNVKTAKELGGIMACVGLANNFAALRAMVKEGIQKGHMKLHAKNMAIAAGANKHQVDIISKKLIEEGNISFTRAKELLEKE